MAHFSKIKQVLFHKLAGAADSQFDPAEIKKKRYRNILLFALALCLAVFIYRLRMSREPFPFMLVLSDAFTVSGMWILCAALFLMADYYGATHLLLYTVWWTASADSRRCDSEKEKQRRAKTFPEYSEERTLHRVFPTAYFVIGGCFLGLAVATAFFA